MTSMERRIQKLEKRFVPAQETAFARELLQRIEAGRRRVQQDRQAPGISEPSDEGLPPIKVHTSHGVRQVMDILNEGRERNHLRWLSEKEPPLSSTLSEGHDLCR